MLLESWSDFEKEFGSDSTRERVRKLLPEKVKKRRKLTAEDGSDAGWEEYYDYIFPEDAANQPNLKLLAMAKMWKRQQVVENPDAGPEKAPAADEPSSTSTDEPSAPPETENDLDRNGEAEKNEQDNVYDDRDDDDVSSTSSESDSDDEDEDEKKEAKQSRSAEEDDKD